MPAPPSSRDAPLLVGRDRELAIVRERLAAAFGGHGCLVLISGEAGIGKTALAAAVCAEAATAGALVLVGHAYDRAESPPYGPWTDAFRYYPATEQAEGSGLPPLPEAFARRGVVGDVLNRATLHHQVELFLTAIAVHQPLVLFLDDLHWADLASLDLVRDLGPSLAALPILLLVAYRDDELPPGHPFAALVPALVREAGAERVRVRHLEDAAVRALIEGRYDLPQADVTRLVAYLQARAEGNALFLGELLRSLEEAKTLVHTDGHWRLDPLTPLAVPPLLRQVIDGRVGRLDPESQRLLTIGAVIGQQAPLDVWMTVGAVSEDALLACIEQGVGAHLLAETSDGMHVRFVHALIREALYEGMLAPRRRRLHRQIGETVAALRDPDPDAVAYHFQQAGDPRAVDWLIRAADQAERVAAWVTAATRCEAALALLERRDTATVQRGWLCLRLATLLRFNDNSRALQLVDEAGQCLAAAGDPLLAAYHSLVSGNLRCISMDADRGVVELEAGRAALMALPPEQQRRVRQIPRSIRLSLDDDGASVLVLWLGNSGRNAAACAIGEHLIADSPGRTVSGREEPARGGAYFGLGCAYAARGMPHRARECFAHSRAEYRAVGHYALVGAGILEDLRLVQLQYHTDDRAGRRRVVAEIDDTEARMGEAWMRQDRTHVAALQVGLLEGDWDAAQRSIEAVLSAGASGIPEPGSYGVADAAGVTLATARGDWQRARELAAGLLPDGASTAPGKQIYLRAMHLQRTAIAVGLETGDPGMALAWLRAHDRWLAWGEAVLGRSEGHTLWARYHRTIGDREQAQVHARQALARATEPRQPLALLAAHRLLGELDTDARRYDEARDHLDAALALADACAAPYERALTLLALAEWHAATRDPAAARTLAEEVRRTCRPLGAHPTLARAAALLERLSYASAISYPDGLSVREVEVLRRIAAGRSNQEIADDLSLSVRTVERHMTNLYRKIGAHTKAQATAYALRQGLS